MEYDLIQSLLLAILIGLMIGLQRSLTYILKNEQVFLGSRTFALISLSGYLSGWIEEQVEGFILIASAAVTLFIALTYYFKVQKLQKIGITTQLAALLTYFLGLMVWYHLENYAIFIAVIIIVLLEIKPKLRRIESRISATDINAMVLLLVMTFVILPILPDKMVGPYNLLNPYKTWLMAVIIASISFIGYIAIKILGHKHGVFITGAAGGLISSTAVTITLSELFKRVQNLKYNYAGGIAIACTFMYIRVLIEAFIVYPHLAAKLSIPYVLAAGSGLLYSYYLYRRSNSTSVKLQNEMLFKNPLQLSEAIKFGILFGIIYGAIAFVENRYGNIGVYIVSFLSGITDVDAITLSLSEMAKEAKLHHTIALEGIVIASATNSLVKLGLAAWIGGAKLGWEVAKFFALTLSMMALGLYFTL